MPRCQVPLRRQMVQTENFFFFKVSNFISSEGFLNTEGEEKGAEKACSEDGWTHLQPAVWDLDVHQHPLFPVKQCANRFQILLSPNVNTLTPVVIISIL